MLLNVKKFYEFLAAKIANLGALIITHTILGGFLIIIIIV